jgi:hypothetical protein
MRTMRARIASFASSLSPQRNYTPTGAGTRLALLRLATNTTTPMITTRSNMPKTMVIGAIPPLGSRYGTQEKLLGSVFVLPPLWST